MPVARRHGSCAAAGREDRCDQSHKHGQAAPSAPVAAELTPLGKVLQTARPGLVVGPQCALTGVSAPPPRCDRVIDRGVDRSVCAEQAMRVAA